MSWNIFKKKDPEPDPDLERRLAELVSQLSAGTWQERAEACRALGALGARAHSAVPEIQKLIEDTNDDVCTSAAAALSDIERDF